ncbi:MAG: hypothetical protein AB8B59_01285 [Maribacter sp.]
MRKSLISFPKVEFVKPKLGNPYWKINATANQVAFLKTCSGEDFNFMPP